MKRSPTLPDYTDSDKDTRAYNRGYLAYGDGIAFDDNPYPRHNKRYWWFAGWLDAKHEAMGMLP